MKEKIADKNWNFTPLAHEYFHRGGKTGVLLLHGFTGTPANMHSIWSRLEADGQESRLNANIKNENDYTIYAPLLTGHGTNLRNMRKSCALDWIDDALKAYDRLAAAGCEKIYVAGLSMGGLLAAIVASERRVDGVIMICAPAKMKLYLHICRFISLAVPYIKTGEPHWQEDEEAQTYMGMATARISDLNKIRRRANKAVSKITAPLLVIQSREDNKVAHGSAERILRSAESAKIAEAVFFSGAKHGITYSNKRGEAAECVKNFIAVQDSGE